ncbi:hypothetical protein BGZ99_009244 [Dissophora globulifera]|uniref:F-box domain-containing protein n=1 Tax=Dissophora globulifera TaxID=979702 RepID=A0A9P6UXX9_9FUNG|nr:hypothetical protein BGZ99_009244 [Dissophora globulifera]
MDIHGNSISLGSQYMDPDQPNPLFIPEIILLVFEYVDLSLYRRLSEVCRLWKSVGHSLAWSHCSMDNRHLFGLLQQDRVQYNAAIIGDTQVKEKESKETMAGTKQEDDLAIDEASLVENFRLVRELKFSEKSDLTAAYLASFKPPDPTTVFRMYKGHPHPSMIFRVGNFFTDLLTLIVRPSLAISQDQTVLLQYFRLIEYTIATCVYLRTLDIKTSGSLLSSGIMHAIARNDGMGRLALRHLRLACNFEGAELLIFQHLIEAVHQLQSAESPIVSGSTPPTPEFEFRSLFCPFLETLYLHNIQPVTTAQCRTPFFQLWSQGEPKTTLRHLTSLTILNFHTGCRIGSSGIEPANWQDYESIDPLLAILRLCPNLTHLRVSYDITLASQPGPVGFTHMVRTLYPHHGDTEWSHVPDDFIFKFGVLIPCLNSLDFGMRPHFHRTAWKWLMVLYRWRLKALSLWNALGFDMLSLTYLIGPPLGHPDRLKQPLQLTKLDLNGLDETAKSAWLVFKQIPTLLDFSARDVPLNATRLVGYDWVCTGLQTLAIYVAVPKEPAKEDTTWTWDEEDREWNEECGSYSAVADLDGQDQQHDYSTRLQIQVCEQLGRLKDLRKLILEGGSARGDGGDGVMLPGHESMKLTLKTGLDRLAPLKCRLETLIVYQLDEQLCGQKEMEWIARHWVHHNNPHWLQTHVVEAQPHMTSTSTLTTDEYSASTAAPFLVSKPTFAALLGISVKNTNTGEGAVDTEAESEAKAARIASLKWFREECPTVSVKTIDE